MAQDITLQGASFSAVPSLVVPKTGGGSAEFFDTTIATAEAADVANGKTFFGASGLMTGTASGGGTVSGDIVLNAQGTYDVAAKATATYLWLMPFRAYINTSGNYWGYYNDSSTSFCFPVTYGKTYTLRWDNDTTDTLYRVAFAKSLTGPSTNTTSATYRRNVFNASGAAGLEQNGWVNELSFTIANESLVLCVVQISGTTELWGTGTIYPWFLEKMTHLTITVQ